MNDIHRTPLLTSWPEPFSDKNFKEIFNANKKMLKRKVKKAQENCP